MTTQSKLIFIALIKRPVVSDVIPGNILEAIPTTAPVTPEHWSNVLKDVERLIIPSLTHWQSPRFHGYFPTGHSYPSVVAGLLCDGLGALSLNWVIILRDIKEEKLNHLS